MAERANATIVEVPASHVLVRVPARGRDPAHPAGRRGDRRSRLTRPCHFVARLLEDEAHSAARKEARDRGALRPDAGHFIS
jgi:hypothetical protein